MELKVKIEASRKYSKPRMLTMNQMICYQSVVFIPLKNRMVDMVGKILVQKLFDEIVNNLNENHMHMLHKHNEIRPDLMWLTGGFSCHFIYLSRSFRRVRAIL